MKLKFDFLTTFYIAVFHVGAIAALLCFDWWLLVMAFVVWCVAGLGVVIGYHRYLTHESFKTSKLVGYILTLWGTLALQSGPLSWIGWHRCHHMHTDKPGDPHSPNDGFFRSHIGWMIFKDERFHTKEFLKTHVPDGLLKDRFHQTINKIWWLPITIFGVTLLITSGIAALLWSVCVPIVIGWHSTWLVNSAGHRWGYRPFSTKDKSTNNWWVALITFGEGWHNKHHRFPKSARHGGEKWWEIDVSWGIIRLMERLGIAREVIVRGAKNE